MTSTVHIIRLAFHFLFLLVLGFDRSSILADALVDKFPNNRLDVSFSSAPLSLTAKYGSLPMSRKELINELQGLGRKATKLQQSWRLRANRYSLQKTLAIRKQAEEGPIVIPVNSSDPPGTSNSRLAFLQLRDCVFVGSGCASPRKMDPNQTSKYMDQMQAILGGTNMEIETKPARQRTHPSLTFV